MSPASGQSIHVMRFLTDEATARRAAALLAETLDGRGTAIAASEQADGWAVQAEFVVPPDRAQIAALVNAAVAPRPAPDIVFEEIAGRDWVAASLAALAPVRVGRFVVHGSHDRARTAPNLIGIEIEAALAFGTGHHGTTQGCLRAIERAACWGKPKCVLDLGTGSGLLAIAVARSLRRPVVASDIDRVAADAARRNAQANRAGAFVRTVHAAGTTHPAIRVGAPYEFVLANIVLGPLLRLARPVATLLAPRATVVISGLLPMHTNAALAAWRTQGLVLQRREVIEGWSTLTLRRP